MSIRSLSRLLLAPHFVVAVFEGMAAGVPVAVPVVLWALFAVHVWGRWRILRRLQWRRDVRRSQYWQAANREARRRNRT